MSSGNAGPEDLLDLLNFLKLKILDFIFFSVNSFHIQIPILIWIFKAFAASQKEPQLGATFSLPATRMIFKLYDRDWLDVHQTYFLFFLSTQ